MILITIDELIDKGLLYQIPEEHQQNLWALYYKVCALRRHSNIQCVIRTQQHPRRGYRTQADHKAIYDELNKERALKKFPLVRIPQYSMHLIGAACDIADPGGSLKRWIKDHPFFYEMHDLYFEHFDATGGINGGWVHCQIYPPVSGTRFFLP